MFIVEFKVQVGDVWQGMLALQPIRDKHAELRMRIVKLWSVWKPAIRQPVVVNQVLVLAPHHSKLKATRGHITAS